MLSKSDEIFFILINNYSKFCEDIINKSLDYKINFTDDDMQKLYGKIEVIDNNNKKSMHQFAIFSIYDTKTNEFIWIKKIKDILEPYVKKVYENYGIKLNTINKLFANDKIKLEPNLKNTIPYIIALSYSTLNNVIRFVSNQFEIYVLIDLDIPNKVDTNKLIKDLSMYNTALLSYGMKNVSRPQINKSKKLSKKFSKKLSKK
jgi:hypothetical protein